MSTLWFATLLAGCREEPTPHGPRRDPPPEVPQPTADTSAPAGTGDTGPPPGPVIDCAAVPDQPVSITELDRPRGWHDVAFDGLGNLIGSDESSLLKVARDDSFSVLVPNTGRLEQMDWLPDGDLVVADLSRGTLVRVAPDGATSILAPNRPAYGVTVGPDGMVYATDSEIYRIDPATGEQRLWMRADLLQARAVEFSRDLTTMYITTQYTDGLVFAQSLDANLDPIGAPTVFATGVGREYHDALGVDWCGNLFVAEYWTNNLYRITPSGEVSVYADLSERQYGHGIEWGSGIGGWRSDAIYLPQPYDGASVLEIVVGVPSQDWSGTVWPPE